MSIDINSVRNADYIIAGTGFTGSVVARRLAEEYNKKVYILERRQHIAGNMYDETDAAGIRVQKYGIHVIHTDNEEVIRFLGRFTDLVPYKVFCLGNIEGKLMPVPFNFISIDRIYPPQKANALKAALLSAFPEKKQVPIIELLKSDNEMIREYAEYLYKHDFQPYTAKQWGVQPEELDVSVISRVPVELSENCDYFTRKYQYMPRNGFTALFEKLLDHPNISVVTGCDINQYIQFTQDTAELVIDGIHLVKPVVFTGPIDEFFGYKYGKLPYRSLRFEYETKKMEYYQEAPFVVYPENAPFTRIVEFKHFTGEKPEGQTTIMREYPLAYQRDENNEMEPYYPIPNDENHEKHKKYADLAGRYRNLTIGGRLADYKYYYMFEAILRAFEIVDSMAKELTT